MGGTRNKEGLSGYELLNKTQDVQLLQSEFYKKLENNHSNHIGTCNAPQRFETAWLLKTGFSNAKNMKGQVRVGAGFS